MNLGTLYYKLENDSIKFGSKVFGFDIDNTLLEMSSSKKGFLKENNTKNLRLKYPNVNEVLLGLIDKGYQIILISNQKNSNVENSNAKEILDYVFTKLITVKLLLDF